MDRKESLQKHISDMLSVEEHILKAVERQRDDERVKDNVQVNEIIMEIERVLKQHVSALEKLADHYDAQTESRAKEALTKLMGMAAGLFDKVRGKHPLSRNLRDNYTALGLASMGYTAFHTYGLTIQEERVANLAKSHLEDLTPLMVEISKLLPEVVNGEVIEESDFPTSGTVAKQAVDNTQKAWNKKAKQGANV